MFAGILFVLNSGINNAFVSSLNALMSVSFLFFLSKFQFDCTESSRMRTNTGFFVPLFLLITCCTYL